MSKTFAPRALPHNPSAWSRRLPAAAVALVGFGIALYLALFQLGVLADVWDPFFGNGSRAVLKGSAIARRLPVPDALLGAVAYLVEAVLELAGGSDRWRTRPWLVGLVGLETAALALTAVVLVSCQAVLVRSWCTLCLCSAACSLVLPWLVWDEVRASLRHGRA